MRFTLTPLSPRWRTPSRLSLSPRFSSVLKVMSRYRLTMACVLMAVYFVIGATPQGQAAFYPLIGARSSEVTKTIGPTGDFASIGAAIPPPPAAVTVLPTNNSTSTNGRAPQGSRRFIRTVYLITPADMTASGFGATTVSSVGWRWNVASPPAAGAPMGQDIATTGNLKIYLQSTTDLGYAKGTNYTTAISGMTLVENGTITIPPGTAEINIDVPVGGAGTSAFSTVAGQGVYVAFDYDNSCYAPKGIGAKLTNS